MCVPHATNASPCALQHQHHLLSKRAIRLPQACPKHGGTLLITLQPHVGACRSPCKILPQKTRAADTLRHAQRGPPAYSAVGTALGLLPAGLLLHYLPYWYQTLAVPPVGSNTTGHHHGAPVPTEWRSCTHPQHTQPKPQGPTTTNLSKPNHPPAS